MQLLSELINRAGVAMLHHRVILLQVRINRLSIDEAIYLIRIIYIFARKLIFTPLNLWII